MGAERMPTRSTRRAVASITAQLAALDAMTVAELTVKWAELFGQSTRSRNKAYLRKRLAWRIQELAEGGLSERARSRIEELAADAPVRWRKRKKAADIERVLRRDPRLPEPGTVLTRDYKGTQYRVTIQPDGFEYDDQRYRSLSSIARQITGTNWNGFLFFGLTRRTEPEAEA